MGALGYFQRITGLLFCLFGAGFANWVYVYNGEHFRDMMGTVLDASVAARNGILVLYGPECQYQVPFNELGIDNHLVYFTYNYVTYPKHTWFWRDDQRQLLDLKAKYASTGGPCLTAYFFKAGTSLDTPTEVKPAMMPVAEWIVNLRITSVQVVNGLHKPILVTQTIVGSMPTLQEYMILPGKTQDVNTYVGNLIHIVDENRMTSLFAGVVTFDFEGPIKVTDMKPKGVDFAGLQSAEQAAHQYYYGHIWTHTDRTLRNLKQPLFIQNFNAIPYTKGKIPAELYNKLRAFYQANKDKRVTETIFETVDSVIRTESTTTGRPQGTALVPLTQELYNDCQETFQPLVTDFCHCGEMKLSEIYGIREYYKGHILHNHVDRIFTHIVGVILQIEQDMGGADDWMLEVVIYDGERRQIKLEPGEYVLYESAKMIHGRPLPLQGRVFANAFMHFKPVKWDYDFNSETLTFTSSRYGVSEPLYPLETELTRTHKIFPPRDEL